MPDPDGEASAGTRVPLGKAGKISILFLAFFFQENTKGFLFPLFWRRKPRWQRYPFQSQFRSAGVSANAGAGQSNLSTLDSVLVSKSRYRSRVTYFISAKLVLR